MKPPLVELDQSYLAFFRDLKAYISEAKLRAAAALNKEVINMYWHIGKQIVEKKQEAKWGDKVLERLSKDLRHSFPEMRGFSKTNLKYMRIVAQLYPDGFGQQAVDQLPWGHVTLLIRIKDSAERHWYAKQCVEQGWSRASLEKQIRSGLYKRSTLTCKKASNFLARLPEPQSYLAQDILKNPYNFDVLGLHDDAHERDIEQASIKHIKRFLQELGKGFAFVDNQVAIEINGKEFFIDMLYYHIKLHCYVVIEIKAVPFKPEHIGQLNFYLSAVDDLFRTKKDNPSIGLLLCKSRDKIIAEYALRDIQKPIGISEYNLSKAIPEDLETSLPTIQEIEEELNAKNPN
jgi:predicted nuclease of restriction endonuclease-like (RecB) superfamily